MKIVVQRVHNAQVDVGGQTVGEIGPGLLVFLGIGKKDTQAEADYLIDKILSLRLFSDENGKMNRSVLDVQGQILVVSQFTLYGSCRKGRRPSYDGAAIPKHAQILYDYFIAKLTQYPLHVQSGQFQAMMDVALVNNGPVTFILEK